MQRQLRALSEVVAGSMDAPHGVSSRPRTTEPRLLAIAMHTMAEGAIETVVPPGRRSHPRAPLHAVRVAFNQPKISR